MYSSQEQDQLAEIIRKSDSKMISKEAQFSDIESPSDFESESLGGNSLDGGNVSRRSA